jgi:hypothetical protein
MGFYGFFDAQKFIRVLGLNHPQETAKALFIGVQFAARHQIHALQLVLFMR